MGKLIQLEIENFKSYRGHHIIGPFKDFTSIIGPNGSGKSNLMDAVSFVLGVNSAQLRSTQLKDLVYRGRAMLDESQYTENGDSIEPSQTNDAKSAQVTAVYEDDEQKELRFMRTVNVNGNSEYKLNGRTVTKQQYNARLEKENILVKARNFLVFQGDVEAIASQSSKDLTKLIEQVSGSIELKADYERLKSEQDRATENSAHNYHKKRGIQTEKKQYQELKAEADRYESLREERDELMLTHMLWKLFHVENDTNTLTQQIAEQKNLEQNHLKQLQTFETELKRSKQEQAKAMKENMKIERSIKKKQSEIDDMKPGLLKINEQIAHATKKLDNAQSSVKKVEKEHDKQAKSVEDLQKELSGVKESQNRFEEQAKALANKRKGVTLTEADHEEYNKLRQEVARQTVSVQQEIDSLARQFKTEEESLQRMKESLKDNENREIKLKEDKLALVERKEKLTIQASSTGKELEKAKAEFANGEMEKRRLNEKEESLNEKLRDVLSKLQEARHDKRQSEKERRNKDCLETLQRLFSGVHGRLIDLCKPHQRKYDNAVSIILGKNIDAIVVDHQKTAIECIQYMREQQYGHFTFIPLDTISAKPINEKYRAIHHHARLAIDVIDYDPSFERALLYACGNALICDNLDTAKWICYEKDVRVKAVTLDGTIIHKSGLITGGTSASQSSSTRWEEKEIENMKRAKDKILSDLQEIAKQKRRVHNDDQLKSHIAGLERQLEYITGDMITTIRKIQSIDDELAHIKASVESSSPELAKLTASFEKTSTKLDGLKQKVYKIEDKLFKEFVKKIGVANIREYEEHQVKVVQELNEKRVEFVSHISRLENQLAFESAQLNELKTRLSTLRSILTNEQSNLEKYTNQKTAIESEITSVTADLSDLQNQLSELKLNYESKTEAVTSVKKNIKRVEKEVEEVRKAMLTHEDIIEKLKGEWYSILRKCKLEEIALPIKKGRLDDVLNMDGTERPTQSTQDPNSMDIDELPPSSSITQSQSLATGSSAAFTQRSAMSSITIDYADLDEDLKEQGTEEIENEFTEKIQKLNEEIERVAPNLKAIDRLEGVEIKAKQTDEEFERAKREAKSAKEKFLAVKDERFKRFMAAYDHIKEKTEQIYKELTKSNNVPLGGSAYLTLESDEEPYLHGVKYHVMPPMKRFRPMDQLSGGEKTVASLALLFAIHSFQPSPFFILDEIDAALDPENVSKVVRYIKNHAKPGFQFIVISLKNAFFQKAQALVGVCRNQDVNTSMVLTLDLEQYEE